MQTDKIKLLIVEDREENREAARRNFQYDKDVSVTFGVDYEGGMQEIRKKIYDAAIFDVEIPRSSGSTPEPLGYDLAREALEQGMAVAIITTGTDHGKNVTFSRHEPSVITGPSKEISQQSKSSSGSWDAVYRAMLPTLQAKMRQKKYLGRSMPYTEMNLGGFL
jgi:hypothetical protein